MALVGIVEIDGAPSQAAGLAFGRKPSDGFGGEGFHVQTAVTAGGAVEVEHVHAVGQRIGCPRGMEGRGKEQQAEED